MAFAACMQTTRRHLVKAGLLTGAVAALSRPGLDTRATAAAAPPRTNPFKLGVASGDPRPDGVVLWTRLAVSPLAADGKGGMSTSTYALQWQVSRDVRFRTVVRTGTVNATSANAHSVHVEVAGLSPGTVYYYRFKLGSYLSQVGRTRTAPAAGSAVASLAMSFAACAMFEHGWFTAYRRLAEDQPDLVLHLGDYQYEYKPGGYVAPSGKVRDFRGPETVTLVRPVLRATSARDAGPTWNR